MIKTATIRTDFVLIIVIGFVFLFVPMIFTQSQLAIGFDERSAQLANNLGGIVAPFLSFFGSVLVYFALRSQIDANNEIKKQFEQQNQDQLFFRLIDALNDRIKNYSVDDTSKYNGKIESYAILNFLVNKFKQDVYAKATEYGRKLLAKAPEIIPVEYYERLYNTSPNYKRKEGESLRNKLISMTSFEERWELLKSISGSTQEQQLNSIGSVHFYKSDFQLRKSIYSDVYYDNHLNFGSFLDGYFNNLKYILKFIAENRTNSFYIDYLKSNITVYEKAFIYYYLGSNKASRDFKNLIFNYDLIDDLSEHKSFFIDIPSDAELKKEIENFMKEEQVII